MPSRPSAQACRNMRSLSAASMCSEKISTGPALRMSFFNIARWPTSSTGADQSRAGRKSAA